MLQYPLLYTIPTSSNLSVLWANEVGEGLWLTIEVVGTVVVSVVTMTVVMSVWVLSWTNVLHLVNGATLWAALDRAVAGGLPISI